MSREGRVIVDGDRLQRTVARMAHEILERNADPGAVALVGIRTRGVPLSLRIADLMERFSGDRPATGSVDIALYRDDVGVGGGRSNTSLPIVGATEIDFDLSRVEVILVDDVLFTGRTIRAAIDALFDYGRPLAIRLAVLVDRGHRELPIRPDFVGRNVPTALDERISVRLAETDGRDEIVLDRTSTPSGREES
ncbi:MAG: bifunctional pyr operon transcriptional regulator/uracil phosphoribosyltransferase PyrR [Actinobacteria bacterium]|nr:bifunctional pyr operon transcriptional regulator/uracil phosphoribosyltransferase PyrR [Actinomycetota bacterium]